MPVYTYKGYDKTGQLIGGVIEADSPSSVVSHLKQKDILTFRVHKPRLAGNFFKANPAKDLPRITRELANLLGAGVPIVETLTALSGDCGHYWNNVLVEIKDRISAGASLGRAMKSFNGLFPDYYCHMIAAGEESGKLADILKDLAGFLDMEASLKNKIKIVMIYPAVMFVAGIFIVGFILVFIIPRIASVFESANTALPLATRLLIGVSSILSHYWMVIFAAIIGAGYFLRWLTTKRRAMTDDFLFKHFKVLRSLYLARFSRILAMLLDSGLPLINALESGAVSVGNLGFRNNIRESVQKVSSGASLSAALHGFPNVFVQIIASCEKSGNLISGLRKASGVFEEDFKEKTEALMALLEPAVILVLGTIVAFIAFAVLLPMFSMEQLIAK